MQTEKTAITPSSSAFSFLEYFLQISLHATTARITNAWAISNPNLTLQFEQRCKDILILDSWIDIAGLASPNSEEDIAKRGFQLVANGGQPYLKFSVGSIQFKDRNHLDRSSSGKISKKLLLCKVAVGRSYYADEEYAKVGNLPEGYDSFYVAESARSKQVDQVISKKTDQGADVDLYYHEYIIKDQAQILPLYVVAFEYDPAAEKRSREKSVCDNCESAAATVFCQADNAKLCHGCDTNLHSANKLVNRHIRTPLGQGPETFGNCRSHLEKAVEFFCPTCHVPVCVYCKMVGHHSGGESARHKLVSVKDAYITVLESAQAVDPILTSRRALIEDQLNQISLRAKLVEKNSADIRQQLEELHKKALNELKLITKKKLTILKGDECELYRQLGEISRLDHFLTYQKGGSDATQFLLNWGRHLQLRSELHAFRFFRAEIDVNADIKCIGQVQVQVDHTASTITVTRSAAQSNPAAALAHALPQGMTMALKKGLINDGSPKHYSTTSNSPKGKSTVQHPSNAPKRNGDFFAETLQSLEIHGNSEDLNDSESVITFDRP